MSCCMNSAKIVGSRFAFSAVAAMEGIAMISTGKLSSLAGKELLDCDTSENCGCWGGRVEKAFEFIIENPRSSY